MKIENFILYSSLLFNLISCTETPKQSLTTNDTPAVHSVDSTSRIADTSLINHDWIYDTLVKRSKSAYEERTVTIEKNNRLNDSVFYVLYSVGTPVNSIKYILPFINNRAQEDVMISEGPDADYSYPYYDYTEYQLVNDTFYHVFHFDQSVKYPEKVLDKDGHFKEGYDFDNVDIKTDTTHSRVRINRSGIILRDTLK